MFDNYCVVDLETSIKNRGDEAIGGNKASPFHPDNNIVMGRFNVYNGVGDSYKARRVFGARYIYKNDHNRKCVEELFSTALLVGHNIKFDLLHLRKNYNDLYIEWVKNGGMVWDTQIVEYLLSGQSHRYPSLDQCSKKYGGTLKDDAIKEYWNNNVDTEDIPEFELSEYLAQDVSNTNIVFVEQVELVDEADMWDLVFSQMDALLALVEIEWNGMHFEKENATQCGTNMAHTLQTKEDAVIAWMKKFLPKDMKAEVSCHSPQQVANLLYGGEVRCVKQVQRADKNGVPMVYKSGVRKGQPRLKKVEYVERIKGFDLPLVEGRSTADGVLKKILSGLSLAGGLRTFIASLLEIRKLSKDISTYYFGYSALTWNNGLIHPNYNQCSTGTGRLSCTAPNLQNSSSKE